MQVWKRCSSCKSDISLNSFYYICSVSTCQQKKTNYVFCSVDCWDQHLPIERHRADSASAIERRAPSRPEAQSPDESRRRVIVSSPAQASTSRPGTTSVDDEVLVVASKIKKYISEKSGMNTSASTFEALSKRLQALCDQGIQNARQDSRKTVMDRDIPPL